MQYHTDAYPYIYLCTAHYMSQDSMSDAEHTHVPGEGRKWVSINMVWLSGGCEGQKASGPWGQLLPPPSQVSFWDSSVSPDIWSSADRQTGTHYKPDTFTRCRTLHQLISLSVSFSWSILGSQGYCEQLKVKSKDRVWAGPDPWFNKVVAGGTDGAGGVNV